MPRRTSSSVQLSCVFCCTASTVCAVFSRSSASVSRATARLALRPGIALLGWLRSSSLSRVVRAPTSTTSIRGVLGVCHLLLPGSSPSSKGTSDALSAEVMLVGGWCLGLD